MKQKLILISGSPCVGKTSVAEKLFCMFDNSAYCDGDWMWTVHPFSIKDERLRNGDKNMSFVLTTYLKSKFDYVFFSSVVLTSPEIRSNIIADIDYADYDIIGFTLTCSRDELKLRHRSRGDENDVDYQWLELPPVSGDNVIYTDGKSAGQISKEMFDIINSL